MNYLLPGQPSAIYLFHLLIFATSKNEGIEDIKPIVARCKYFAEAMQIHFHADVPLFIDGELIVRLVFNIKEPYDSILIKVPLLFSFAAMMKFTLINQFFYPEETN